eukprot:m.168830 g.168830  ORF g.168830 m.168830 type:complete len:596 (+) comp13010_c0_seq1:415-2202(+)
MPAQNQWAEVVRHPTARFILVHLVPRDLQVVEVPREGIVTDVDNHIVPESDDLRDICHTLPNVHHRFLGQIALEMIKDFRPLHWAMALFNRNLGNSVDKVGVATVASQIALREPLGDRRRARPARCVDLIASQVHKVVLKHPRGRLARSRGHPARALLEHLGDDVKGLVVGDVEGLEACRARTDFRVACAPRACMAGHVKFDHNANATSLGIVHNGSNVTLHVPFLWRVGSIPQFRVLLDLKWVALGVRHVPVQHIQLGVRQRVNHGTNGRQGLKVSSGINHKTSVREPRCIVNRPRGAPNRVRLCRKIKHHQLRKRLETAECAIDGGCRECRGARRWDRQCVRLVRLQLRVVVRERCDGHGQACDGPIRLRVDIVRGWGCGVRERDPRIAVKGLRQKGRLCASSDREETRRGRWDRHRRVGRALGKLGRKRPNQRSIAGVGATARMCHGTLGSTPCPLRLASFHNVARDLCRGGVRCGKRVVRGVFPGAGGIDCLAIVCPCKAHLCVGRAILARSVHIVDPRKGRLAPSHGNVERHIGGIAWHVELTAPCFSDYGLCDMFRGEATAQRRRCRSHSPGQSHAMQRHGSLPSLTGV